MKKILYLPLLAVVFLLPTSTFAITCLSSDSKFCTTDKSDFYQKNIGNFEYLDWAYNIENAVYFVGDGTFRYDFVGKYESVAYTIKDSPVVDYHVSIVDFPDTATLQQFFSDYVKDFKKVREYKNKYGTVYEITGVNSTRLSWIHNNILVSIHVNPDALKKEEFLRKAFNIYAKKIKPQNLKNIKNNRISTIKERAAQNTSSKKNPIVDIKINGSDNPYPTQYGNPINVTWTSTNSDQCTSYGLYTPKRDGSGIWGQGNLKNLPTSGSLLLSAAGYQNNRLVFLPEIELGIDCYNNSGKSNYSSAQDSVSISVY